MTTHFLASPQKTGRGLGAATIELRDALASRDLQQRLTGFCDDGIYFERLAIDREHIDEHELAALRREEQAAREAIDMIADAMEADDDD